MANMMASMHVPWDLPEQQDFYQYNDEYALQLTEDDRSTEDETDEDEDENAKYIKDGTDECQVQRSATATARDQYILQNQMYIRAEQLVKQIYVCMIRE